MCCNSVYSIGMRCNQRIDINIFHTSMSPDLILHMRRNILGQKKQRYLKKSHHA